MPNVKQEAADIGVKPCPNDCELEELELGKNESSFTVMLDCEPPQYIRCSECKFGNENFANAKHSKEEAIVEWNRIVDEENAKCHH